jgi:hypothetical protein
MPSHLDYKYIKSYEGPMTKPNQKGTNMGVIKEEDAPGKSIRTKKGKTKGSKARASKVSKVLYSFERKKYGGIRMC